VASATATYALFALAAIGGRSDSTDRDFVPIATVMFALVLLVITFVALVQRAFELTQIGGILRGLMRRAGALIDDVRPLARSMSETCRT
jgi:uncharacterized membrane protein